MDGKRTEATLGVVEEDLETRALRRTQAQREEVEREEARRSATGDETAQHDRRADKAEYLKQKLEQRAAAERDADGPAGAERGPAATADDEADTDEFEAIQET